MNTRIPLVIVVCLLPSAIAANQDAQSLCTTSERVVFTCSIAKTKKIVSLCATPQLSNESGQLTYRYGVRGLAPELAFSNDRQRLMDVYWYHYSGSAKASYYAVRFHRSNHSYTVYYSTAAFEAHDRSNGGGVMVHKGNEKLVDMWCDNSSIRENFWATLNKLGLPDIKTGPSPYNW